MPAPPIPRPPSRTARHTRTPCFLPAPGRSTTRAVSRMTTVTCGYTRSPEPRRYPLHREEQGNVGAAHGVAAGAFTQGMGRETPCSGHFSCCPYVSSRQNLRAVVATSGRHLGDIWATGANPSHDTKARQGRAPCVASGGGKRSAALLRGYRRSPVHESRHEGALEDRRGRACPVLFPLPSLTRRAPCGFLVAGHVRRRHDGRVDTDPPIEQTIVDVPNAGGRMVVVGITGGRRHSRSSTHALAAPNKGITQQPRR